MVNAERTYVDPSALRRLYIHDQHSRSFCAWIGRVRGSLPLTLHGKAELVNSIALAVFRRDITAAVAEGGKTPIFREDCLTRSVPGEWYIRTVRGAVARFDRIAYCSARERKGHFGYWAVQPPSTGSTVPVTSPLAGDAR